MEVIEVIYCAPMVLNISNVLILQYQLCYISTKLFMTNLFHSYKEAPIHSQLNKIHLKRPLNDHKEEVHVLDNIHSIIKYGHLITDAIPPSSNYNSLTQSPDLRCLSSITQLYPLVLSQSIIIAHSLMLDYNHMSSIA